MTEPSAPVQPRNGRQRIVFVSLGMLCLGLGFLGAILPLLPTTPFLLLASFCFVRSSPRLHEWLLQSRFFGRFLRDWHRHRGVRPGVRPTALTGMGLAVFASAYYGNLAWHLVLILMVLAAIGAVVVVRLPVIREQNPTADPLAE